MLLKISQISSDIIFKRLAYAKSLKGWSQITTLIADLTYLVFIDDKKVKNKNWLGNWVIKMLVLCVFSQILLI